MMMKYLVLVTKAEQHCTHPYCGGHTVTAGPRLAARAIASTAVGGGEAALRSSPLRAFFQRSSLIVGVNLPGHLSKLPDRVLSRHQLLRRLFAARVFPWHTVASTCYLTASTPLTCRQLTHTPTLIVPLR